MEEQICWGAHPEDWQKLMDLGLTEDLLPVVSNIGAGISPGSSMRDIGKTPSMYNKEGYVAGIVNWTQKTTTESEINRWMQESDYGICIQTRLVRALDIDVHDKDKASKIKNFILDFLGQQLPLRYRENSGKCLLAFRMAGKHKKRVIKTEGGIIEFLANGQQFIAVGEHPSGVRYEWSGFEGFPTIDETLFEELWLMLVDKFGSPKCKAKHFKAEVDRHNEETKDTYLNNEEKVKDITEKLKFIDAEDYHTWITIGMILKGEQDIDGFSIWNDWSSKASNYNGTEELGSVDIH